MVRWLWFVATTVALVTGSSSVSAQTDGERQNFDKIKLDMTEAEVKLWLPSTPKKTTTPDGFQVLTWGSDNDNLAVYFADGKVSTIQRHTKDVNMKMGAIAGIAAVALILIGVLVFFIVRQSQSR